MKKYTKGKGANQYGRYIWTPEVQTEATYVVSLWGNGFSARVSGDDKELVMVDLEDVAKRAYAMKSRIMLGGDNESQN